MSNGYRVTRRAFAFNCDRHGTRRQCANVCRWDGCTPGAVCQHRGGVGFAVHGYHQRGACCKALTGAGDDQVLRVFDAVDHIVARHGINAQARQIGINGDVALARAAIAVAVSHAC